MARIAIIGAASGIGAACLEQLLARGDEVIAFDRAEVTGAHKWTPLDLAEPAASATKVAQVAQANRPFDAIIANAGLPPRAGNAELMLAVNVFGLLAVTEALLPHLVEGGALVITASRAGREWRENLGEVRALLAADPAEIPSFIAARAMDEVRAYNLSKEALIYWAKTQVEPLLARGQRVNTVSPAPVATGILDDFLTAFGPRAQATLARTGRAGTPEEIAATITFLASPESSWLNGQDVIVDGGMAAMLEIDALA